MISQDKVDITYELDVKKDTPVNTNSFGVQPDYLNQIKYNRPEVPLHISEQNISSFPSNHTIPHWHEDFELLRILSGEMHCKINTKVINLRKGDCIFINSSQMHFLYSKNNTECSYECINLHPSLITSSHSLHDEFIMPFFNEHSPTYIYYPYYSKETAAIQQFIDKICILEKNKPKAYELSIIGFIDILFVSFYGKLPDDAISLNYINRRKKKRTDLSILQTMISFIHNNYSRKISLNDIAASGGISRSKCCNIFADFLHESPNDFLNFYRLDVSYKLLKTTDKSITDISVLCGFKHLSYFSKSFLQKYNCTPSDVRKKQA
ncbi:AraC family transcriptional regulator [Lachnobacterium bovis]|uniref:AraC-type DNA-binding protein n=1 Tax=Lachnobacterium bovis TaxID=140626 RepID=A0A1H9SDB6_9FIRM|nr:AraC family transcriptional regulator [Lachnobacterium bovis]SER82363.1 AraC-type DNA-binding protein [Lachnobacterium bovis]